MSDLAGLPTLTPGSGAEAIAEMLDEYGFAHVSGVIDHRVLDAVEDEMIGALRARCAAWSAAGRVIGASADGPGDLRDRLTEVSTHEGFTSNLLAELDITLPHAPFAVVTDADVFHLGQAVLDLVSDPGLLDLLSGLLGNEITASANQHCRIKLPTPAAHSGQARGAEAPTLWHQDLVTQMPEADDTRLLTCWIAAHDTSKSDGCLVVAPRRHHDGLLPWPFPDDLIVQLEDEGVPVPARRGDVILMDKRTPHASLPNVSGRARWSFDLRYHPSGEPTDRPWFPAIPVRSAAGSAVRSAVAWRDRWEAARLALIESGQPIPGRAEWAQPFADAMVRSWTEGSYPRCAQDHPM